MDDIYRERWQCLIMYLLLPSNGMIMMNLIWYACRCDGHQKQIETASVTSR